MPALVRLRLATLPEFHATWHDLIPLSIATSSRGGGRIGWRLSMKLRSLRRRGRQHQRRPWERAFVNVCLALASACAAVAGPAPQASPPATIPDSQDYGVDDGDYPARGRPFGFEESLDGVCRQSRLWQPPSLSPTALADRVLHRQGVGEHAGHVTDVDCVFKAYPEESLRGYADKGDPLAVYAITLRDLLAAKDPCLNRDEALRDLQAVAEAPPSPNLIQNGYWKRGRFPEAYLIMSQLASRCGDDLAADKYMARAGYYGYAPAYLYMNRVEPSLR